MDNNFLEKAQNVITKSLDSSRFAEYRSENKQLLIDTVFELFKRDVVKAKSYEWKYLHFPDWQLIEFYDENNNLLYTVKSDRSGGLHTKFSKCDFWFDDYESDGVIDNMGEFDIFLDKNNIKINNKEKNNPQNSSLKDWFIKFFNMKQQ